MFGGNSSSKGMDNSVIKLEISNTSGASLHDYLTVDIETRITTKEAQIKSATMCSQNTRDCPEITETATDVSKTVTSTFFLSNTDDIFRITVKGDGFYTLYLKANSAPNETDYDVFMQNIDSQGPQVNYTAWDIKLKTKGSKSFLFVYDVMADDITEIHAVMQSVTGGNVTSSGCESLDLSGTSLKMAKLSKDGKYENPKSQTTTVSSTYPLVTKHNCHISTIILSIWLVWPISGYIY